MHLFRFICMGMLLGFVFSGTAVAGSAMHTKVSKKHCNEMVASGQKALEHGELGHGDIAIKHLKKMIHEAEGCVKNGEEGIRASDSTEATKEPGRKRWSI